ncbi:MAG TPA: nickel pincer cofactor biosynthesis protein LarC [Terracidiphilus sp.]|nr:nickel pincer cofactor biosynthesis protein LarC [Terracidiphilus sp.]
MRIAYLECFSGISGDMLLGAMVDAGVPLEILSQAAASLNLGARLESRKVLRGGITGTKVDVLTSESSEHSRSAHQHDHEHPHDHAHNDAHTHEHSHEHTHGDGQTHTHEHTHDHGHDHEHTHEPHRSLSTILNILSAAPLAPHVKESAARAFQLLGEAEARIHDIPVEQVHFHEVGAIDTIVDIVCAAAAADFLAIDRWLASPLNVGSGTVHCAHGTLPVPAPATLALLGCAPMYADGPAMERVTPTGATLLRMLNVEYAPLPPLRIQSSGYGAGGRETPGEPNLLRLLIGEAESPQPAADQAADESGAQTEPIAILETVIDDSTPQLLAYVSELLLESGAWDVYRIPVQMKKGRNGVQLTVLCAPPLLPGLRDILFRETTTIGAHWRIENKIALRREFAAVETPWGAVRIKIARSPSGDVLNASPEYEDCRRIAAQSHVPLKEVMRRAAQAYTATPKGERP